MPSPRFFDSASAWTDHPQFPGVAINVLESRATHPGASVTLTRVAAGQGIPEHIHAVETETAYVLSGRAQFEHAGHTVVLAAGSGVTIPPGIPHSLRNIGDGPIELIAIHVPPVR